MTFRFDEEALDKWVRESDAYKSLQAKATETVQGIARGVNASHAGRPVAEVDAEMRRRFAEAGVTPTEPGFTNVVNAIAEGSLTDDDGVTAEPAPPSGTGRPLPPEDPVV